MPWKFPSRSGHRQGPVSPPPAEEEEAAAPSPPSVFLARQPVVDGAERVLGYSLLVRPTASHLPAPPRDGAEELTLLVDVLNRFGVEQSLGDKLGFLKLSVGCLASELMELLPRERFVIEIPEPRVLDAAMLARLKDLRARGLRLALPCPDEERRLLDLAAAADLVIYDLGRQSLSEIARLDTLIKAQNVQRLVRHVRGRADFEACRSIGFEFYQGELLARPETLAMNRLDPSRARVIEIFNLVINRADIAEVEDAFKHDVALCYSLLCYANSAGIGLPYKVASIRDAVMILGYEFLWRWLSLLIFAGVDLTAAQRLLLNTAVIRARLAELLGQSRLSSREANHLFITGMFSLLDTLLGMPFTEVAKRLHLPDAVAEALISGSGPYAPYLRLALAFESDDVAGAARLCEAIGVDMNEASRAHLAAIEWAGMLAR